MGYFESVDLKKKGRKEGGVFGIKQNRIKNLKSFKGWRIVQLLLMCYWVEPV